MTETANEDGELGFDQVVVRLREVVDRLEQGSLSLEEALRAYEDGVGLARRGHELLDAAEKRVELLVRGARGDSEAVTRPLDGDTTDGDEDDQ
jgi:exodeoxyribonuclease VII small subunit